MTSDRYRTVIVALLLDAYAAIAGVIAWRWWHHDPVSGAQFASLMVPMSFYLIARLVRESGPLMLLPPVLVVMWLGAMAASPFCLTGFAARETWFCIRLARTAFSWKGGGVWR